jgi:hypothetical protein
MEASRMPELCVFAYCYTPETIVSWISYLFTVMITTVAAGHLVKMGTGYGKIFPSESFQSFPKLFVAFLIEAVVLAVAFEWIQPWLTATLLTNLKILVSIVVEAFVVYYLWFCLAFSFNPRYKVILIPQILVAANLLFDFGSLAFLAS